MIDEPLDHIIIREIEKVINNFLKKTKFPYSENMKQYFPQIKSEIQEIMKKYDIKDYSITLRGYTIY